MGAGAGALSAAHDSKTVAEARLLYEKLRGGDPLVGEVSSPLLSFIYGGEPPPELPSTGELLAALELGGGGVAQASCPSLVRWALPSTFRWRRSTGIGVPAARPEHFTSGALPQHCAQHCAVSIIGARRTWWVRSQGR